MIVLRSQRWPIVSLEPGAPLAPRFDPGERGVKSAKPPRVSGRPGKLIVVVVSLFLSFLLSKQPDCEQAHRQQQQQGQQIGIGSSTVPADG